MHTMEYLQLKVKMSEKVGKAEEHETNVLSQLGGYPHLVKEIFSQISISTLINAERVSPCWQDLIQFYYNIDCGRKWERLLVSPTKKVLAARLAYKNWKLNKRMKNGDASAYSEAYKHLEKHCEQMLQCEVRRLHGCKFVVMCDRFSYTGLEVDERNVYIGINRSHHNQSICGSILIINRWTGKLANELFHPRNYPSVGRVHSNDQVLAIKFSVGEILVYDAINHMMVQVINDKTLEFPFIGLFCIERDILANMELSFDRRTMAISVRRQDSSTGLFGPHIEAKTVLSFESVSNDYPEIYLDKQLLFVDVYSKDWSKRIITVFDVKSLKQVRRRTFRTSMNGRSPVKRECHDGVIVVEDFVNKNQLFLAAWHVEEDTVKFITNCTSALYRSHRFYSATLAHTPSYQFILAYSHPFENNMVNLEVLPVEGRQRSQDSPMMRSISKTIPVNPVLLYNTHFDGVQCIFIEGSELIFLDFII